MNKPQILRLNIHICFFFGFADGGLQRRFSASFIRSGEGPVGAANVRCGAAGVPG